MRWRSGFGATTSQQDSRGEEHVMTIDDDEPDGSCSPEEDCDDTTTDQVRRSLGATEGSDLPNAESLLESGTSCDTEADDNHMQSDESDTSNTSEGSPKQSDNTKTNVIEDDDGKDHSQPPDESQDEASSRPPWRPQDTPSTIEFSHTILNYSQKRESGCKKAEYSATSVDEFGNRWRLIVYVNGNGRASNHHLSLFLQVADADDLPFGWKKSVSYVLTLEHPGGQTLGYAKRNPDKTFKLCPKAIDWGWSQFITSDRIQQEGYISNDSLTVRAQVTVKESSVNIEADDAELYLKCAVEEGNASAVKLCLAQGAGVNCKFKDDLYTPLHTACSSNSSGGSMDVLNLLLEEGADGNACNKWRETPLLIAANNGHLLAVEALLRHNADPSLCSEAGWSALTFAAHKGYEDIVALLLKAGAPVNCRVTEDSSTPLHKACAGGKPGHLSAVRQLIDAGADVHALNKWRETPLLTAANHGNAGAVESLLKAGADPCKCTDTGWSPLSIAAYKGHDDVVRLLLEEGAPTEEADPSLSALLQAATKGLPDTVELLLRHGADHTVTTKKGDTALSILVEQNLIDAAVEMVSEYKASVPRCSRDRKKVQRARLLINLRMKQLQREGLLTESTDDEDETDEEYCDNTKSALHDENSEFTESATTDVVAQISEKKKKKKKTSNKSAEEQARAAEEALLLELQQEDEKAKKEEADANSKREKKRKKKERERQLKLKEDEERREQEAREAKERERQQREKEDQQRKEREHREQEIRERKLKESEELERQLSIKRKEREARERRQRDLEVKEREKTSSKKVSPCESPASSISSDRRNKFSTKGPKKNQVCAVAESKSHDSRSDSNNSSQSSGSPAPSQPGRNRAWETPSTPETHEGFSYAQVLNPIHKLPRSSNAASRIGRETVSLSPRPSGLMDSYRLCSVASDFHGITPKSPVTATVGLNSMNATQAPVVSGGNSLSSRSNSPMSSGAGSVEHPAVALYRQEKLTELLKTCAVARSRSTTDPLRVLEESTIKKVVYRWIVRASHGQAPFLDCIIPSWVDLDLLKTFFQRQFIAESRSGSGLSTIGSGMLSIEALKDAGTAMAVLCHKLVKDVAKFRSTLNEEVHDNWTDALLGVTASNVMKNGTGAVVVIDWAGKSQACVPSHVYAKLQERYIGPPGKLLSAVLGCQKRYETKRMVASDAATDFRLTTKTQACLARDAHVSFELWSDPCAVYGNNLFTGKFHDVDTLFGGLKPFAKEEGGEELMATQGGSASVLLPLDSMIAARYVRSIVDLLESADSGGVPLSFAVFAHKDCFRELKRAPKVSDLNLFDSRLELGSNYVLHDAVLNPGQHIFQSGDAEGFEKVSSEATLFVVFQNVAGRSRYPFDGSAMAKIVNSMSLTTTKSAEAPYSARFGFSNGFDVSDTTMPLPLSYFDNNAAPMSPEPSKSMKNSIGNAAEYGNVGGVVISNAFSPTESRRGRRGRLFDLIDDGEDEAVNDADAVSGMLNNLNGLFQNNLSQDVDIEAISLMGIGGAPMARDPALPSFSSSRSSRMFG